MRVMGAEYPEASSLRGWFGRSESAHSAQGMEAAELNSIVLQFMFKLCETSK